jgi:hypothetical protein
MNTFSVIFGTVVSGALLWWLGSLVHEYFTDEAERSHWNKQPGELLLAIVGAAFMVMGVVGICIPAFGNLPIPVGDYTFRVWAVGLIGMAVVFAINYLRDQT